MSLLTGILKRLPLTKRFVDEPGRAGFFAGFVRPKAKCNEEAAISPRFDAVRMMPPVEFVERCSRFPN
jgi:hypothetical protein